MEGFYVHYSNRGDLELGRLHPLQNTHYYHSLDRSVGVRGGVAHHLVPLLGVARVVRRHVLLAGVGTVGMAVSLGGVLAPISQLLEYSYQVQANS